MTMTRMYWKPAMIAVLLVFVSACAGLREATEPAEEADELPTPEVDMAQYEDFDPTPYEEPDLAPAPSFEHDVPERLMEGRADEGVTSEVQGFRIQVHSSLDKGTAVEVEEEVKEWLRADEQPAPSYAGDLPIYVVYMQPYYRVRIGNFASRERAERARQYLEQRFPDAFIVPDTVSITR